MIYLDCAASAPIHPTVIADLSTWHVEWFANPSAAHKLGRYLDDKIEESRKYVLQSLGGGDRHSLVFTSGATESNNHVIRGIELESGDKILYCPADHPSVSVPALSRRKEGINVVPYRAGVDGTIDYDFLLSEVGDAKLLILSSVNSQSGNLHDLGTIVQAAKEKNPNLLIHIDATQSFGKLQMDFSFADSVSVSAHKLGGPKGVGGLMVREGLPVGPLLYGGGQQDGLRASTLSAPLICAFARALELALEDRQTKEERAREINLILRERLQRMVPEIKFPFPHRYTSPYILTFINPTIYSDVVMRHLEERNIFVSSTSACSSKVKSDNSVLDAFGISPKEQKFILRLSFDSSFTESMMDTFIAQFKEVIDDLKFLTE